MMMRYGGFVVTVEVDVEVDDVVVVAATHRSPMDPVPNATVLVNEVQLL